MSLGTISITISPGPDHAAHREGRQADHRARGRGADLGPAQLGADGFQPGRQVEELFLGLAQLLGHFGLALALDLIDLQAGLADRLAGAGGIGLVLSPLAVERGGGTLQRQHPGLGREALFVERPGALQFVADQRQLTGIGRGLGLEALDLGAQLHDALLQDVDLVTARTGPGGENPFLTMNQLVDFFALAQPCGDVGGKDDRVQPVALGDEPGFQDLQCVDLLGQDRDLGREFGVVQAEQQLTRLHPIAFTHRQFGDDAAIAVLHGLAVVFHHHHAGGDRGAVERGESGPAAQHAEEQHRDDQPGTQRPAGAVIDAGSDRRRGHAVPPRGDVSGPGPVSCPALCP
nr:hypothetical protein [Tistrella mobilis]